MTDKIIKPIVTIVILSYNPQEHRIETFLLHRTDIKAEGAGQWCVPGGGLEFSETWILGAMRELEEETGLRMCAAELQPLGAFTRTFPETGKQAAAMAYWVQADDEPTLKECEYHDAARWFAVGDLAALNVSPQDRTCIALAAALFDWEHMSLNLRTTHDRPPPYIPPPTPEEMARAMQPDQEGNIDLAKAVEAGLRYVPGKPPIL